jgi:hypothetical protein
MTTLLLIAVVAGCVLVLVVHFGRQFWSRARVMERHQQALDTLGGITHRPEGESLGDGRDHQAHVRVVGPRAQSAADGSPILPPPRVFTSLGPSRPSTFRRPSQAPPSAAEVEGVALSERTEPVPVTKLVRSGPPRPPVRRPVGRHAGGVTAPAPASQEPTLFGEPPTRPVPVVQPEVFYFDDFARRQEPGAANRGRRAKRRHASQRDHGGEGAAPEAHALSGRSPKAAAARALSAAAVLVAAVAIGVSIAKSWPSSPKPPRLLGASHETTSQPALTTSTTAPAPVTTVPTQPPKPAVLVSTAGGTATYELGSRSASIVVSAKGPCWLEVRVGSHAGQVVYEGTLDAGQRSSVTGPAWLRLGNPPNVSVAVNGTLMAVPGATKAVPINLVFTLG